MTKQAERLSIVAPGIEHDYGDVLEYVLNILEDAMGTYERKNLAYSRNKEYFSSFVWFPLHGIYIVVWSNNHL